MPKAKKQHDDYVVFNCPGCGERHCLPVGEGKWEWNGSVDAPTFRPSILVRQGHYVPGHEDSCWCTYNAEHADDPAPFKCGICHSFVTDGRIEFVSDSTHWLCGQTADLPEWRPDAE